MQRLLEQLTGDPENFGTQMNTWVRQGLDQAVALIGDVGRNAAKLGFALITVFFFYRDGDKVLRQVQKVLRRFLGERVDGYLVAVGSMTKAVVWGLVATALAQGVVAGLGYWWAGVAAPILLSAVTALIAMIPFGTPFAWGSIGIWLLISGDTVGGIGLLLWGALVVSWVDNLVRPLVISNATRIPFVLVMFGVLGGTCRVWPGRPVSRPGGARCADGSVARMDGRVRVAAGGARRRVEGAILVRGRTFSRAQRRALRGAIWNDIKH